uniref:Uncharacterized protein n=1 Tax=Thermocrispum agreste TaxID=37925 RepID=A0A2W4L5P6_9PSEU|nr:MAG: hypothetical protein DIU77_11010 [Thermocrispum agreste]
MPRCSCRQLLTRPPGAVHPRCPVAGGPISPPG